MCLYEYFDVYGIYVTYLIKASIVFGELEWRSSQSIEQLKINQPNSSNITLFPY